MAQEEKRVPKNLSRRRLIGRSNEKNLKITGTLPGGKGFARGEWGLDRVQAWVDARTTTTQTTQKSAVMTKKMGLNRRR